jgi:3-oxoacyl-[acyl-carrier protein] reductase
MVDMDSIVAPSDLFDPAERFRPDGVALVTGAGGGIGRATAFDFAAAGVDVALTDRRADALQAVESAIETSFEVGLHTVAGDLTDINDVDRVVEETVDELGGLDVLVNVAGGGAKHSTPKIAPSDWDFVQDNNLKAPHLTAKAAYSHLRGGGAVVNLSSTVATYGSPWMSHYAAAKAGVRSLTRSLATEWAGDDIRVNAVSPGPILTLSASRNFELETDEDLVARVRDRSVVDRDVGDVSEVADAILFLASPAASHLTGLTIPVAGVPPSIEDVSVAKRA